MAAGAKARCVCVRVCVCACVRVCVCLEEGLGVVHMHMCVNVYSYGGSVVCCIPFFQLGCSVQIRLFGRGDSTTLAAAIQNTRQCNVLCAGSCADHPFV